MERDPVTSRALDDLPSVETHISRVFLAPDEVFKIKKPVDMGFLDFTTLEKRKHFCKREVELNRRLAPEVYLGVVPVMAEDKATVADWAVHMRRLDEDSRADRLLEQEELDENKIDALALTLSRFHEQALCDEETTSFGERSVIEGNLLENFEQTEDHIDEYLKRPHKKEVEEWQIDFLAENEALFQARQQQERIRDCHGDLRLEHVYFRDDRIDVIDCIEFNERFRYSDVCADIAFLAMDLTWNDAPLLAERLLSSYALASNDYDLYALIDFYESYRAFVRAKIALFSAHNPHTSVRDREHAADDARRYFLLALASERRRLQAPVVYAVGGLIASGKSTLARSLSHELGAPVVSADPTRKWLLGVEATTPVHDQAFHGAYSERQSRRTYEEMMRRAGVVLRSGRPVVLDASFRSADTRRIARDLAHDEGVPFRLVECTAPREVLIERLEARQQQTQVSDGRLEILDDFIARYRTPNQSDVLRIETTQGPEAALRAVLERFPVLPHQLP